MVLAQKATQVPMSTLHSSPRAIVDRAATQAAVAAKLSTETSNQSAALDAVHLLAK